MYTVSNLKEDIEGALHGTNLDKVQGINNVIWRAARELLLKIDPKETKRIAALTNPLFDKVNDASLPSDLKGEKIVDIRSQANRVKSDNFTQNMAEEFELYKKNNTYRIQHNSGTKSLRVSKSLTAGKLLNECDSETANGTWAEGTGASNLVVDEIYFITSAASLKFDVGATGGYIENASMTQVDLIDYIGQGYLFLWLYIPTSAALSALTSVSLRWGSSDLAYYSKTTTQGHFSAFQVGWNLVSFDWSSATLTGSPTATAYDYLRVTITTTSAINDFRVDSIIVKLPSIWEVEYYSKYLFRSSAGVWQEQITSIDDSEIINLDTESYNLLFNKTMHLLAPQVQGEDSQYDAAFYENEYKNGIKDYTGQYKSDAQRSTGSWYRFKRKR